MEKILQLTPKNTHLDLKEIRVFLKPANSLSVFDELIIQFLNDFSRAILKNRNLQTYPEIVSLAFWLRKANILKIQDQHKYWRESNQVIYTSIGTVFHVCPANVDTMFMYSLAVSMLCGNNNIVRISDRIKSFQIDILINTLNELLSEEQYESIKDTLSVISYERNIEISSYISMNVDCRVIWGGDNTVNTFKSLPSKIKVKDLCFADRISVSTISIAAYKELDLDKKNEFVRLFFNDSYTFDQQGCSSPHSIFFVLDKQSNREANEMVINDFYCRLSEIADRSYENDLASIASLKLNAMCDDAIDDTVLNFIKNNNRLVFTESKEIGLIKKSCGAGYFYFNYIDSIQSIGDFLNSKVQTISYFGLSDVELSYFGNTLNNIMADRIVPIGKALEFNYIWDGYNLFEELTRKIYIQ